MDPASAARILVVDDELPLRRVLRITLNAAGYTVAEAQSGLEGVEKAERFGPELVLVDIEMPGLDGFATCRAIQTGRKVPVIVMTARNSAADKATAREAGASDFLTKPFTTPDLLARIRTVLEKEYAPVPGSS